MHYWNGSYHEGSGRPFTLVNPATGETTGEYTLANAADVNEAVASAKAAYPAFKALTPGERAELMLGLATQLEARADELAELESMQTGKSIRLAKEFDVPGSIDNAKFFAGAARQLTGLAAGTYWEKSTSMTRREPLGVVGSIAPWNYPLQMAAWKIFPAVAAGNTIVLKTSEMTPGTSLILA